MYPTIELKNLSFKAQDTNQTLLEEINFKIEPGERVGLVGPSGSGKTTLCFHLCALHQKALTGYTRGQILIQGAEFNPSSNRENASAFRPAMILQNPESQLFSNTVIEEMTLGYGERFQDKIHNALNEVGLAGYERLDLNALSLGEKQRVVLAAFLIQNPSLFVFDEPSNSLDSDLQWKLLEILGNLSMPQVMIEHNLELLTEWADRVIEMRAGKIVIDAPLREWLNQSSLKPRFYQVALELVRLNNARLQTFRPRDLIQETKSFLKGELRLHSESSFPTNKNQALIRVENISCGYHKKNSVLRNLSLSVNKQERIAILGKNGAGKTTLLKCFSGLVSPSEGRLYFKGEPQKKWRPEKQVGKIGFCFQNPDYQLFDHTVESECGYALRNLNCDEPTIALRVEKWLEYFGLNGFQNRSPFSLSYGEKRRLTLASILVSEPELIFLDEPTTALDEHNIRMLENTLCDLSRVEHKTVVFATHDLDFALNVATRFIILGRGKALEDVQKSDLTHSLLTEYGFRLPVALQLIQGDVGTQEAFGSQEILEALEQIQ